MKQLSLKRGFCFMLTVVVSCFFMLVFLSNLSKNSFRASASSSSSYSGYYNGGSSSVSVDTAIDVADYVSEKFGADYSFSTFLGDIFSLGAAYIGAIFSDETTFSDVYNNWSLYISSNFSDGAWQEGSGLEDAGDFIRWAFYYGSDGELHFTDEYINSIYDYITPESYNQGIVQIPPNTSERLVNYYTSTASPIAINAITSYLSSSDPVFVPSYISTFYFDDDNDKCATSGSFFTSSLTLSTLQSSFSNLGIIIPFSSYSNYVTYLNYSVSSYSTTYYPLAYNMFLCYNDDGETYYLTSFSSDTPLFKSYSTSIDSHTGIYTNYGTWYSFSLPNPYNKYNSSYFGLSPSFIRTYYSYYYYIYNHDAADSSSSYENYDNICKFYLMGSVPIQVYTSVDWYDYYNSGEATSGVVYASQGDIYGALTDLDSDWSEIYSQLQDSYSEMLSQGKTLDEISETLSVASEEIAEQTGYLKSIASYCKTISEKLTTLINLSTVDTVADTVTAAASVVDAVESFVDDLIDDTLDGLYDSLEDALLASDSFSDLLSSFKSAFPFSLPYDFFLIINLLAHDPVTPEITWRMKFDSIGFDEVYSYDLSAFDSIVSVIRVFSSLLFIIALIKITMRLRKKE